MTNPDLAYICRVALREKHDAMGASEGSLSERMRRFAADMRGDGIDRRDGEYAVYADAIIEFAKEVRETEMAAHAALDDGTEGEEEDYPDALTKKQVAAVAEDTRCRFEGADFAPNGLYVLALRESSGGDVALCHDEETACIVSEALTAYFAPRFVIAPITEDEAVGQSRTGRLPSDLTVDDIARVIGFPPNHQDDRRKVKHSWGFSINGVKCGIWDYYDARWSIYDPEGLVRKLFGLDADQ